MASPIVKGQAFGTTETVTAAKLQNIVDSASFKDFDGSTEVFNVSGSTDIGTCVLAGGLAVKTSTGQLQLNSQADQTVIGNVSGGSAVPTAVPIVGAAGILVNSDSLGTDDTKGATQGNIKAYVDGGGGFTPASYTGGETTTFPNGLIIKFGQVTLSASAGSITFGTAFPNACISVQDSTIALDSSKNMGITAFSATAITVNPLSSGTYTWLAIGH